MILHANVVQVLERLIRPAHLHLSGGCIERIVYLSDTPDPSLPYVLPGFVDAHVHIESSMLTPAQFARLAVVHGTVATVSDPHEIGNVLGVEGIKLMVENGRQVPFKLCFGAPSCVPATVFETAGAVITPQDIEELFVEFPEIGYLAEVMNFPGVLNGDPDMLAKIAVAQRLSKPIDGHAPGLRGEAARRYAAAGPQTDHECFSAAEALDKLACGMKILIREGSAAKNFEALIELLPEHYPNLMFCSDDKHPDNLVESHLNELVKRALRRHPNHLFEVLQMACINPVLHYRLPVGLLQEGDPADFILIDNLLDFNVLQTYINGQLVAERGVSLIPNLSTTPLNKFECTAKTPDHFEVAFDPHKSPSIRCIEVLDGQLITNQLTVEANVQGGALVASTDQDILKIAVVNRYTDAPPAVAFIKNFGLQKGALASCVAHDSHNIVAVGTTDASLCEAVNLVIAQQGGIAAVGESQQHALPLPIAGIMSGDDAYAVAQAYSAIDHFAKHTLGCSLQSPFMSLSFMALLVIPSLKLSDKGLFDGEKFSFCDVQISH